MLQSQETGTITDIDGIQYKTVKIGDRWWMAENLRVSKYLNGDDIPNVTDDVEWSKLSTGAWAYYENDSSNNDRYGKLYNWFAVNDSRGLCPTGWHMPDDDEWTMLTEYLGDNAGGKMKSTRTDTETHPRWEFPNLKATNESGLSGTPGGYRHFSGGFGLIGDSGFWWSFTEDETTRAWYRYLYAYNGDVGRDKGTGFSVYCISNE